MKTEKGLERTFHEVSLNLRQWATWKLQNNELDINGKSRNVWEGMSPEDQRYNLAWNGLTSVCRSMTAEEVKKVYVYATRVNRGAK